MHLKWLFLLSLLLVVAAGLIGKSPEYPRYYIKGLEGRPCYYANDYTFSNNAVVLQGYKAAPYDDYPSKFIYYLSDRVSPREISTEDLVLDFSFVKQIRDTTTGTVVIPAHSPGPYTPIPASTWLMFWGIGIGIAAILYWFFSTVITAFTATTRNPFLLLLLKLKLRKPAQPIHTPNITSEIAIPENTQGIIATRDWNASSLIFAKLKSRFKLTPWESSILVADKLPQKDNTSGIYAVQLGVEPQNSINHLGIVVLTGKCVHHTDGIIRAERCQILMILCRHKDDAKRVSANYGIPVVYTRDVKVTFRNWLLSEKGIYWLKHNQRLLRQLLAAKKPDRLTKEVTTILETTNF